MSGILIIRLKGMGDIVHTVPILRVLRKRFPEEKIGFLCQKPFSEVVPEELAVDFFEIPARASFIRTLSIVRQIRKKKYSKLVDLFCNPRTALISLLSGIPWRAGFDYRIRKYAYNRIFVPKDSNCHLSQLFAEFLDHFGIGRPEPQKGANDPKIGEIGLPVDHPGLKPVRNSLEKIEKFMNSQGFPKPLLGINPHATYPSKCWPPEHFERVIRWWHEKTGNPSLIFWGPGEEKYTRNMIARLGEKIAFTHPPLSIKDLMALLSRLDLFLTGDSGPMNLSWGLNVPTVALFGPTTRKAVAPKGDRHLSLFHPKLACLQCHKETCDDRRCMTDLQPDYVIQAIEGKYPGLKTQKDAKFLVNA